MQNKNNSAKFYIVCSRKYTKMYSSKNCRNRDEPNMTNILLKSKKWGNMYKTKLKSSSCSTFLISQWYECIQEIMDISHCFCDKKKNMIVARIHKWCCYGNMRRWLTAHTILHLSDYTKQLCFYEPECIFDVDNDESLGQYSKGFMTCILTFHDK